MKKPGSLTLLVCGLVLMIVGINATNSLSADVTKFFTRSQSSTDNAIWLLMVGSVAAIAGLVLTLRHRKQG